MPESPASPAARLITVDEESAGQRLDNFLMRELKGVPKTHIYRIIRSGEVRRNKGRVSADDRVQPGDILRIPPLRVSAQPEVKAAAAVPPREFRVLHEDDAFLAIDKPAGVAVHGGSGVSFGVIEQLRQARPGARMLELVHRLDRDTSGVLVVARTRGAAQKLTAAFRERDTKKIYWSLVKGVPRKHEDKISTWLVKEQTPDGDRMRIARHGEDGADHAVSYYRVVDTAAQNLAWLEMEPYTGRTHQLRVHALHIGHPIIGDPKYFIDDHNWDFPGGVQKRLHLHARYIDLPHPNGGRLKVTAPLPPHMVQTWNLLGLDQRDGDRDGE